MYSTNTHRTYLVRKNIVEGTANSTMVSVLAPVSVLEYVHIKIV